MISSLMGIIAGILTTISLVPQVYKSFKTGRTEDLSLPTFLILLAGITSWFVYGLLIQDYIIVVFNLFQIILICSIIYIKLWGRKT